MKRFLMALLLCFLLCAPATRALAIALDLSSFSADDGVTVDSAAGRVTFVENDLGAQYMYTDDFVLDRRYFLTFDYTISLGASNDDTLVVDVDYAGNPNWAEIEFEVSASTAKGHAVVDLSAFQGKTVSLDFGLVANDLIVGTTASMSNFQLLLIPEPGTCLLVGGGLLGAAFSCRRRKRRS